MPTYRPQHINGEVCYEKPIEDILAEVKEELLSVKRGGAFESKALSMAEQITGRQRRWYKGVCLPHLVKNDENGETKYWWDDELKRLCNGLEYLNKEIMFFETAGKQKIPVGRLTTKGVGVRNMTNFIEEILSQSVARGWGIAPPDPDLRKKE